MSRKQSKRAAFYASERNLRRITAEWLREVERAKTDPAYGQAIRRLTKGAIQTKARDHS